MKKAVMYGAGNIGRGFIGQLFYMSGYETTFIDINMDIINWLNTDGWYPIYITRGDRYEEYLVKNVRGINGRDISAVAEAIAQADIAATAVGVNVLRFIAEPFAEGIKLRCARGVAEPLNIIICENMIGADEYFKGLIKAYLDDAEKKYFDKYIGLVEPSIGRMVPATPKELLERHPLAVCAEEYCELPVDKRGFKGEIPEIAGMVPFEPFDFYIRRKLFLHNMSHAMTAYLGALKGYTYIWEATLDPEIQLLVLRALMEAARALHAEHGVPLDEIYLHAENLLYRFENKLLGDTIERVGRDTKRKLSENDRLAGAASLCYKHGIMPSHICLGIAAGYMFAPEGDEPSREVAAFVKNNGLDAAMAQYSSIVDAGSDIALAVKHAYSLLQNHKDSFAQIIAELQKI
ncbi:MAG TPA: mannitol dehydrogenase [Bacillota bacterium]|nr:mannitol dehydrogenase [Clostridiales bacterium]HPT84786.1 mannitol dehydrogenase [Bacillota bacterium]